MSEATTATGNTGIAAPASGPYLSWREHVRHGDACVIITLRKDLALRQSAERVIAFPEVYVDEFLDALDERDRVSMERAIEHAIAVDESVTTSTVIDQPGGPARRVEAIIVPLRVPDEGSRHRVLGILHARDDARDGSGEPLREATAAREAAEHAVRQRDAFISSAIHDLRTPLTFISGRAQLMHRRLKRTTIRETWIEDGLNQIMSGIQQINDLLTDLQDIAFLQIGRPVELNIRRADLVELTRSIEAQFVVQFPSHHFALEARSPSLPIDVDVTRIHRVIGNLLSNAVKYSDDGTTVRLILRREASDAFLEVADEGIGIPEAEAEQVFVHFQRGSNVDTKAGTGIGLAGSRTLARQHHGELTVKSTLGSGSTFTLRLPIANDERAAGGEQPPVGDDGPAPKKR